MTNDDVKQMLVDLRGGLPEACDFCKTPTEPADLHPEEGGLWACITCINRWEEQDRYYSEVERNG